MADIGKSNLVMDSRTSNNGPAKGGGIGGATREKNRASPSYRLSECWSLGRCVGPS